MPKKVIRKPVPLSNQEIRQLADWCVIHGYGFTVGRPATIRIEGA